MESKVQAESSKATWLDPHYWFKIHSFYIFIFFIIHALLKGIKFVTFYHAESVLLNMWFTVSWERLLLFWEKSKPLL